MGRNKKHKYSLWTYYIANVLITFVSLLVVVWLANSEFRAFLETKAGGLGIEAERQLNEILHDALALVFIITVIVSFVSFVFFKRIYFPLKEIREGADRFSKNDFGQKLPRFDVQEIDYLGHAMNKMASQLKHLEKVRRDFVANVSHELKTPITSIKGYVQTLLEGAMDNADDTRRFLEIVSKQSERMTSIIDDLLTLSRLERERASELLLSEDTSLKGVLNTVYDLCLPHAQNKGVELSVECEDSLSVRIDRSLMEQAVINLVDNAIKYTESGKAVSLIGQKIEDGVEIIVKDQGPGVPEEHIPRLFERFYRVDKARSRKLGGTGLGLSIVKHIVSLHKGSVNVSSILGQGAEFSIELKN